MPEEAEIDIDKLRDTIDEEMERGGGQLLRWISLTTALLAAFAAIASLRAGATVNEALVMKTEATRLQAEASDAWAFYQAKGVKLAVVQANSDAWRIAGKTVPAPLVAAAGRYPGEQDSIRKIAESKERDRDARSEEADHLLKQHHRLAYAVAFFQIAIALGAVSALTRSRPVWWCSLGLGAAGAAMFLVQLVW